MKDNHKARELNFFELSKYIKEKSKWPEVRSKNPLLKVTLYEKNRTSLNNFFCCNNRDSSGYQSSPCKSQQGVVIQLVVNFCYYILRAVSSSLGEAQILEPFIAAWLPNIIVLFWEVICFTESIFWFKAVNYS